MTNVGEKGVVIAKRIRIITITVIIGVVVFLLVGCSSNLQDPNIVIPDLIEYDRDFRAEFADELDYLCTDFTAYPKTCTFIRDSIEHRARIRALQD